MSFTLELALPSTDGQGVKRWRCGFLAGGSQEVFLFRRPKHVLASDRDAAWFIRVVNRSGEHIETRFYKTRSGAKERLGRLFGVRAVVIPECAA